EASAGLAGRALRAWATRPPASGQTGDGTRAPSCHGFSVCQAARHRTDGARKGRSPAGTAVMLLPPLRGSERCGRGRPHRLFLLRRRRAGVGLTVAVEDGLAHLGPDVLDDLLLGVGQQFHELAFVLLAETQRGGQFRGRFSGCRSLALALLLRALG